MDVQNTQRWEASAGQAQVGGQQVGRDSPMATERKHPTSDLMKAAADLVLHGVTRQTQLEQAMTDICHVSNNPAAIRKILRPFGLEDAFREVLERLEAVNKELVEDVGSGDASVTVTSILRKRPGQADDSPATAGQLEKTPRMSPSPRPSSRKAADGPGKSNGNGAGKLRIKSDRGGYKTILRGSHVVLPKQRMSKDAAKKRLAELQGA